MFDTVLLLGGGGHTVYLGPAKDALSYFHSIGFDINAKPPYGRPNDNPADYMIDVISGHILRKGHPEFKPHDLIQIWKENEKEVMARSLQNDNADVASSGMCISPEELVMLATKFDTYDKDHDGKLTCDEFCSSLADDAAKENMAKIWQDYLDPQSEYKEEGIPRAQFIQRVATIEFSTNITEQQAERTFMYNISKYADGECRGFSIGKISTRCVVIYFEIGRIPSGV